MNSTLAQHYSTLEMYQGLRDQLMDSLVDTELAFRPGQAGQTLGELCREIGQIEHMYTESFKTFTMDYVYPPAPSGLERSVEQLTAWYATLDQALRDALEGLSDDDVANRMIDRGGDFKLPPQIHLEVYREALLIFYGKASVYLKAMGKEAPQQWQGWIG